MQKKLIAVAIAGMAAAPAFAQTSNITIYGRANLGFGTYSATGAAAGSAHDFNTRNRVYDAGSRLGFRGTENLGNGLKARFQVESGVNMDTGSNLGQSGSVNANTGYLGGRVSYLGLQGGFGEVRAGRQNVHWTEGRISDISSTRFGFDAPISTGSGGMVGGPTHRASNVLMYLSPKYSGFDARLAYLAAGETAVAGADVTGKGWSLNLNYNNGPIAVKYDYTTITAQNGVVAPAAGTRVNSGHKLGIAYYYQGKSKVGLTLNRNKHENSSAIGTIVTAGDDLTQSSWVLNWEHFFGNFQSIVSYGEAAAVNGMTGVTADPGETKFKQFVLGGVYRFSKRTHMYVAYTEIVNGQQQWADFTSASMTAVPGNLASTSAGADPRIVAIGMMHNF